MMTTSARAVECGQKPRLFVPGEYPCVRRFRHRRLLTFLWLQGYGFTFIAMLKETNYFFCVHHLVRLVSQGHWTKALDYIFPRFLPRDPCWTPSLEARVLVKFLRVHRLYQSQASSKLSRDWRPMWAEAANIVRDLVNMTPEFKDRLLLLDRLTGPQSVLPIGFGFAPFRRRRHVKDHTRPASKHAREKVNRRIAHIFLEKSTSVPSPSHCSQEFSPGETIDTARDDWCRRIFEQCIKAATCLELNQGRALQSSEREGASVTGVSQPQIGDCPRPQTQFPAANRHPLMTRKRALVCGQGLQLFVPGEYPCVRRFRYRRFLAFLKHQGYGSAFVTMLKQTNYYFCVSYLAGLVSRGLWTETFDYIFPRFLPLEPCSPPSLEATVLIKFLRTLQLFQLGIASKISQDWRSMWAKAAKIVQELANRTPEFKDRLLLPDGLMGPQNILPIGFGFAPFRRRWHVKKCTRPTRKHARRIANIYFDKRSLLSSSHGSQELSPEILATKRDDLFLRIFEECIKASACPDINHLCELLSSASEGTVREICSTESACQGSHPRKRPMTEHMEDYLATKKRLTTGTNGEASSAISQTMLGTMACLAKDYEVIATTNADQEVGSDPRKRPMTEQMEDYSATKMQLTTKDNVQL